MPEEQIPPNQGASFTTYNFKVVDVEDASVAPYQQPSFVNATAVWHVGTDIYVDMGFIPVEDLLALKPGSDVKVITYERFVMSRGAFEDFVQKVNRVHGALTGRKE